MHWLIVRGMFTPALAGLALVCLVSCVLLAFDRRGWFEVSAYGLIALTALVGLWSGRTFALYLPPVVLNLLFALAFSRTLRAGATPLIERSMRLHHGDNLSPAAVRYGRQLTWVWTIFFVASALLATLLAVFAPLEVWSLFANFLNYLLVAVLFVGQFVYGYLRHGTMRPTQILPMALRVARRGAGTSVRR
jgi:uncharacterized membrane protein